MIKCPGCGGALLFEPASQRLVCSQCSQNYDPEDFRDYRYTNTASEETGVFDVTAFKCPNCGAELLSTDDTALSFCSYCGSNVLLESHLNRLSYPKRIIPFKKTRKDAENAYLQRLKASLYAPSDLRNASQIEKFRGIYMPYWNYDTTISDAVDASGKKTYQKGDYEYTDHYKVSADVEGSFDAAYFDASSGFSDDVSDAIKPFDLKETLPFTPAYMAGFYADAGDVSDSTYQKKAEEMADNYFDGEAVKNPEVLKYNAEISMREEVEPTSSKDHLSMYPVWFLSCRTNNNRRISYAAVNGQTGKVAADIPIDFRKYLIGSLILAVPVFLVLCMFLTLTTKSAILVSAVLSIIGMLILNSNINSSVVRISRLDDAGYLSKQKSTQKTAEEQAGEKNAADKKNGALFIKHPLLIAALAFFLLPTLWSFVTSLLSGIAENLKLFSPAAKPILYTVLGLMAAFALFQLIRLNLKKNRELEKDEPLKKSKILVKPLLGVLFCVAVYFIAPVSDIWYYAASAFSSLMMILSIRNIIDAYNIRTTHAIPQLSKLLVIGLLSGGLLLSSFRTSAGEEYEIIIKDQADLLSDEQEQALYEELKPLLQYGNAGVITVSENPETTAYFSRVAYHGLCGNENGTILFIDMANREIYLFSDGRNYEYISDDKAYSITDNSYRYLSDRDYYGCASETFREVKIVLDGGRIAEPMRYINNALLALLIAFLSNFLIVDFMSKQKPAGESELIAYSTSEFIMQNARARFTGQSKRYNPHTESSSSGGFTMGGGGGFSGGGGGGVSHSSGGGGGHSF